jgi:23S rRNA (guanosine2251-2'-O)-methyltransferase
MRKLQNDELNRLSLDEFRRAGKIPLVVVLDNVRSMHNIGSVFRSADAFLVERILLCGITAVPPHKDIHKSALGATDSVKWEYFKDTQDAVLILRKEGYRIIGIEQAEGNISLTDFKASPGEKYAVIFGHEVRGVQQDVIDQCDLCIEIPQFGTKHSLNISVCAGIVIWEFYRKIRSL